LFYCLQADDEISEQDEEESENFTDYILSEEEDMSNENSQTAQQIGWFSGWEELVVWTLLQGEDLIKILKIIWQWLNSDFIIFFL